MRLAIVTDIHHGKPQHTKRGDTALDQMARFAEALPQEAPDLVLDLGDRITDEDAETDRALMGEVAEAFASLTTPVHHICGNHDLYHLSAEENARILGQPMVSEVIDTGSWRLLLWRADARITWSDEQRGFSLPEADFLWLTHQLTTAEQPVLVLSHVPVSGHSQIGNYYFEANPDLASYPQAPRIREALALARVPVVWLAGHVHWNTVTQSGGSLHLTQQSLTESFTTQGAPAGAWSTLDLGASLRWEVHGFDPFTLQLPVQRKAWVPPLAPFPPSRPKR